MRDSGPEDTGTSTGSLEGLRNEGPLHIAILLLVIGVGVALRASDLVQPMRYDEAYGFSHFVTGGLPYLLSNYGEPNNHLFHTAWVFFAWKVFGNHPWALRVPAFIAGCLILPMTYLLLRRLFDSRVGLLATAWAAVAWPLVAYSANARGYTIQTLLVLVALWIADGLRRRATPMGWGRLGCTMALGFWTIPTTLYPFGAIMAWLAFDQLRAAASEDSERFWWGWWQSGFVAAGLTLVFYLPVVWVSGLASLVSNRHVRSLDWGEFTAAVPGWLAEVGAEWARFAPPWLWGLWLAGAILGVLFYGRRAQHRAPLWLPLLVWPACLLMLQRVTPFPRVWLYMLPVFLGLAAVGLLTCVTRIGAARGHAFEGRIVAGIALVTCLLGAVTLARRDEPPTPAASAPQLAAWMQTELVAGDVFATHFSLGEPLRYYGELRGAQIESSGSRGATQMWSWGTRRGAPATAGGSPPPGRVLVFVDRYLAADYPGIVARAETLLGAPVQERSVRRIGEIDIRELTPTG